MPQRPPCAVCESRSRASTGGDIAALFGLDFVAVFDVTFDHLIDCFVAGHQLAVGGEGRYQMQAFWPVCDCNFVRPALRRPGRKARLKQFRIDPVHHHSQPIGAGNAEVELGKPPKEGQMRFALIDDVFIVVSSRTQPGTKSRTADRRLKAWRVSLISAK
jgi:hypothetical protein